MPLPKPKTRTFTYFLFGGEVRSLDDAFSDKVGASALQRGVYGDDALPYALHVENKQEHEAGWARDVARAIGIEALNASTSSAKAAMAFEVVDPAKGGKRIMGSAWGQGGRHFLNLDAIDDFFGMKTAMNLIDPGAVRSKDSRSFDDSVKLTRTQSSRLTSFDEFDYDPMLEILDSVTARVLEKHNGYAKRVSGSHYLKITGPMDATQLFDKARHALDHFARNDYEIKFSWVKNKRSETNPVKIQALDEQVIQMLQANATTNLHLAPPTVVDWECIEGFLHKRQRMGSLAHDLDIADYLAQVEPSELTPKSLRNDAVRVVYLDGRPEERWPIYRCLVAEVDQDGKKYILSAGRWFRLNTDWVEQIDQRLASIQVHPDLPTALEHDQKEAEYNQHAAEQLGAVLMDQVQGLRPTGASSDIELCDLLTDADDLEFIHVKRRESSATLSHLYMQGSVSAQTVTSDETFRAAAKQRVQGISPDFTSLGRFDALKAGEMEVVYAVIAEDRFKGKENLPFFSKVSLCQTHDLLRRFGFGVSFAHVPRPGKQQSV